MDPGVGWIVLLKEAVDYDDRSIGGKAAKLAQLDGAVELLEEGEIVTVDGYLGIVTVGAPTFDLEEVEDITLDYAAGRNKPGA